MIFRLTQQAVHLGLAFVRVQWLRLRRVFQPTYRAATAHSRGHRIYWTRKGWVYADGSPEDPWRNCARCGRPPTPEGHDACLGTIPGVEAACCGHGVGTPYMMYEKERR